MSKKNKTENKSIRLSPSSALKIPARETILALLRKKAQAFSFFEIAKSLKVKKKEEGALLKRLQAMCRDQQLIQVSENQYQINQQAAFIAGKVQAHRDGFGFVIPEKPGDDLFLSFAEMKKVMHNDSVLVSISGYDRKGRAEAHIVEVVKRANQHIVGRLIKERDLLFLSPEDKRVTHRILITENQLQAQPGEMIVANMIQFPNRFVGATAQVIERLGQSDEPGMEVEIALRRFDLPYLFSEEAIEQAQALPDEIEKRDLKGRIDLREMLFVTIDGEDARDFDDAVYAEYLSQGEYQNHFRLRVAIADVSHYVKPNTPLDQDALDRATSVYFPFRVIPMLPEKISNGLCSLNPKVDRCVLVSDMVINQAGELQTYEFYPAVIHSAARLTYTQVAASLTNPSGQNGQALKPVLDVIHRLYAVYQALFAARQRRGAIDFETTEMQLITDSNGKIKEILPRHRNEAHRLIEECMLIANVSAADFMRTHQHLGVYRVHDRPSVEKLQVLRKFLSGLGLSLDGGETPQAKDFSQLIAQIKGRVDAELIQTMLLRSMRQAVYSPDNIGHFGLAYEQYTHFTSPIRRYPDLLTHRVIYAILQHKKYHPKPHYFLKQAKKTKTKTKMKAETKASATQNEHEIWVQLATHCATNERRADEAVRDIENWLKCYFMQARLGEEYVGVISGVTAFGFFVQLKDLHIEGLVHVTELKGDYFQFDEARYALMGGLSGQCYSLLDVVKVRVARVDLDLRKIDFSLIEPVGLPQKARAEKKSRKPVINAQKKTKKA